MLNGLVLSYTVSHGWLMLCSLFLSFFFLCFILDRIYCYVLESLFFSSAASNMVLIIFIVLFISDFVFSTIENPLCLFLNHLFPLLIVLILFFIFLNVQEYIYNCCFTTLPDKSNSGVISEFVFSDWILLLISHTFLFLWMFDNVFVYMIDLVNSMVLVVGFCYILLILCSFFWDTV